MTVERRELSIGGRTIPLEIHRVPRARRIILTSLPTKGVFRLSLPRRISLAKGMEFVSERHDWIADALTRWPTIQPVGHGSRVPFNGEDLLIEWEPKAGRRAVLMGNKLIVGGPEEHVPARVARFLKEAALKDLTERTVALASAHQLKVAAVSIGDPSARWGSCSWQQKIRFSWRLICAPEFVRQYVVAHEVAHLRHMNHSADFWAFNAELYGGPVTPARAWLRAHGSNLYRIGV
ncbi:M48 family metallopeptidase [Pedomonas mirosovicensis]|uniref:M48 family metallopeptidase n=1 Tax=Pedomonas mirosovicensis TaxID=2908641 RepID=UPI002168467A|nr:M48 family metallopeptidase [Pedomonas mirosovicensis]MCH8684072.1 M48 family metallopeptidase [Pedomonas mirosovicensis]